MALLPTLIVISSVLFVLLCVFLVFIVLIQPGRSGGLTSLSSRPADSPSAFSETLGVQKSDQTLFVWTSTAAGLFFFLALMLTLLGTMHDRRRGSIPLPPAAPPAAVSTTVPAATDAVVPAADSPAAATPGS